MLCVCFHRLMIVQNTWAFYSLSYLKELIRFQHVHGSGHHDDAPERLAIHLPGGHSRNVPFLHSGISFALNQSDTSSVIFFTSLVQRGIGIGIQMASAPQLLRSNSAPSSFHLVLAALISPSPPSFHNPLPGVSLAFSKVVIHACKTGVGREQQAFRWK